MMGRSSMAEHRSLKPLYPSEGGSLGSSPSALVVAIRGDRMALTPNHRLIYSCAVSYARVNFILCSCSSVGRALDF